MRETGKHTVIRAHRVWVDAEGGLLVFCRTMGAKNGKGMYRCANGVVYNGRWKDDMRHG